MVLRAVATSIALSIVFVAVCQADQGAGQWTDAGSLNQARFSLRATTMEDGQVLVTGGFAQGEFTTQSDLYDPSTGIWTQATAMRFARGEPTATLLSDGKLLVAGGYELDKRNTEVYDPSTHSWTTTGPMNSARTRHTATLLPDGRVLAVGGWPDYYGYGGNNAEIYDPATQTWSLISPPPSSHNDHVAVLLPNGKVLVAGGNNPPTAVAELYDPATNTWTSTGTMNVPRTLFGAVLLENGKVLVMGGYIPGTPDIEVIDTAELYDPDTGTWTLTSSMHHARGFPVGHQPILLADGSVLVAGGDYSATSEVYLPSSGTWTSPIAMGQQRWGAATALLHDGRVLIVGGRDFASPENKLASAEIYDPQINPPEKTEVDYFALGDSIASGHGLNDDGSACRRSEDAYPAQFRTLLSQGYRVNFQTLACSGATVREPDAEKLLPPTGDRYKWFHNQVIDVLQMIHDDRPTLITINIGANDLGWINPDKPWLDAYHFLWMPTKSYFSWLNKNIERMTDDLRPEMRALLSHPNPNVRIVLTEVYNPTNPEFWVFWRPGYNCSTMLGGVTSCYERTEYLISSLNAAYFLDVFDPLGRPDQLRIAQIDAQFAGHEASCGFVSIPETWIQHPTDPYSNSLPNIPGWIGQISGVMNWTGDCFHPNRLGAQTYAEAVNNTVISMGW